MPALLHHLLLCPVCAEPLEFAGRSLACARGHRFDAARQGYINLLTGRGTPLGGDTAEMVAAREDFLGSGQYEPLRAAVVAAVLRHCPEPAVALDAGAGTGYYLQALVDAVPALVPLALDISKFALRRAARRLPTGISLVWDVWQPLPVAGGAVDVLLNVFAPRNPAEFMRLLAPDGCLVVVTPRPGHLAGLEAVGPLLSVPAQKADDVLAAFDGALVEAERRNLDYLMELPAALARSALIMGPAARHRQDAGSSAPAGEPASLQVSARFTVQVLLRPGRTVPTSAPATESEPRRRLYT